MEEEHLLVEDKWLRSSRHSWLAWKGIFFNFNSHERLIPEAGNSDVFSNFPKYLMKIQFKNLHVDPRFVFA